MDILGGVVKHQGPAVRDFTTEINPLPFSQLQQQFLTQLPQIPGDNQVKILRGGVKILQMGPDGGKGGRGRSQG